jgi:hypothetical protein
VSTKSTTKPARPQPAEIAKARREGKTWNEVREHFGIKLGSGPFTEIMATEGYNAAGIRAGSKQTSKAISRANGGAKPAPPKANGKPASAPKAAPKEAPKRKPAATTGKAA